MSLPSSFVSVAVLPLSQSDLGSFSALLVLDSVVSANLALLSSFAFDDSSLEDFEDSAGVSMVSLISFFL